MSPIARFAAGFLLSSSLAFAAAASHAAPALSTSDPAAARLAERRVWAQQVRTLREQERAGLDSLTRSLDALAPGHERARAQRELEDAKRAWRRRMLEAQLARAQAQGTPANAARLRARLAELDASQARRASGRAAGGAR